MSGSDATVHLLDVNVLIALFDPGHIHHEAAHDWFAAEGSAAWATCPLTENGFLRVLSNPGYSGRRTTVGDAAAKLSQFVSSEDHVFWPDDVSALDSSRLEARKLSGYREVTDAYLLALAVAHEGVLVTFDAGIRLSAAVGAEPRHVRVLDRS